MKHSYTVDYETYKGIKNHVRAVCPYHGPWNTQAYNLIKGRGCSACASAKRRGIQKSNVGFEKFVERAREAHGNDYEYNEEGFTGMARRVKVVCPDHGPFTPIANHHVRGQRYPRCVMIRSYGELAIYKILVANEVKFEEQWSPEGLRRNKIGRGLRFDFFLLELNTLIEFDGIGHFQPIKWSKNTTDEEAQQKFERGVANDAIKNEGAEAHGYNLYRLTDERHLKRDLDKILLTNSKLIARSKEK